MVQILKWCRTEQGTNEVISGVVQNEKTEQTLWQPWLSSSEHIEVLHYP